MLKSVSFLCFTSVLLAPLAIAQESKPSDETSNGRELTWVSDFAAAKEQAKKEDKHLFLFFTGSDWCHWCEELEKDVFSMNSFKNTIEDHYVMVELDFPRKKELPDEVVEQNAELNTRYGVAGYPAVFMTDAEGTPYGKSGYRRGGSMGYIKMLDGLREKKAQRDADLKKAGKMRGVKKAKALDAALSSLDANLLRFYPDEIEAIIEADKKDKAELHEKYQAILDARARDIEYSELLPKIQDGDLSTEEAIDALKTFYAKYEGVLEYWDEADDSYILIASIYRRTGKYDEAIEYLEMAMESDPDKTEYCEKNIANYMKLKASSEKAKKDAAKKKPDGKKG